jgi:hypothetical protein
MVERCMGSTVRKEANNHLTPVVEMDWHQKIWFADAGSPGEGSTRELWN